MTTTQDTQTMIEQFARSTQDEGRSAATVRAYKGDVVQFVAWAESVDRPIDAASVTAWLSASRAEMSPASTRRRAASLRRFIAWAGEPTDALDRYKLPVPKRTVPHPLTGGMEDIRMMLFCSKTSEQRALVALQGFGALRVSEARATTVEDIDFETGVVHIRGKGDKERDIVFSTTGEAFGHLRERATEVGTGPLVTLADRSARQAVTSIAKRAGVRAHTKSSVSSHDLRATAATALYEASGHDIRLVQEFLGHSSVKQTEIYVGVSRERLTKAVGML